jgi:hypothetical protein
VAYRSKDLGLTTLSFILTCQDTSYERSPSGSTVNVPMCPRIVHPQPIQLTPNREKVAPRWPISCPTNSYVFLLFKDLSKCKIVRDRLASSETGQSRYGVGRPLDVCIEGGVVGDSEAVFLVCSLTVESIEKWVHLRRG